MIKYILKRTGLLFLVFFIILTMCFILVKLLPLTDEKQFGKDENLILQRREALGYEEPLSVQYGIFIKRSVFGGDWGVSETLYRGQEVWAVFVEKLPATLLVNVYAVLFSIPAGLLLGIYMALKKNGWQDGIFSVLNMVLLSLPGYVCAFLIQYFLCYRLQWFPLQMKSGTDWFSNEMCRSVLPAALALGLPGMAELARYMRSELSEVLKQEFMLFARMKGFSRMQTVFRHGLHNAMVPVFPVIMKEVTGILAGSIVVEKIFGIPGVGQLYINSIVARDYNFFMFLSAFYTFTGLLSGLVADISYCIMDPRIRMGER